MDEPEKVCTACGETKPLKDGFYSSVREDGRVDWYGKCKACHNGHVAERRREKIGEDPDYLRREAERVAEYRKVDANRLRANKRSTANHEALSRLKARYPAEYEQRKTERLKDPDTRRSVALYRATRDLRDDHFREYRVLYREALERKGVT